MALKIGEEIKALIYGSPGTGKTRFCGSASTDPRTAPVLMLDLEGGIRTLSGRTRVLEDVSQLGKPLDGTIDVLRVRTWPGMQKVYDFLFEAKSKDTRGAYNTLIVDSLTEANQMALMYVTTNSPMPKLEVDIPEQRDYQKSHDLMKKFLRGLRDLEGLHVFYTALPKMAAEETSSIARIKPSLVGRLAEEAMAILDFVGYLRVNNTKERELVFQPEGRVDAKERTREGFPIGVLVQPTVSTFLDAIEASNEGRKLGTAPAAAPGVKPK